MWKKLLNVLEIIAVVSFLLGLFVEEFTDISLGAILLMTMIISTNSKEFADWVTVKMLRIPWLKAIGGFVTALTPTKAYVNLSSIGRSRFNLNTVILHEQMHLELLFKKYRLIYTIILIAIVMGACRLLGVSRLLIQYLFIPLAFALIFTFYEIETNREIKERFGVKSPEPENKVAYYALYLLVYFVNALVITFIFDVIDFIRGII